MSNTTITREAPKEVEAPKAYKKDFKYMTMNEFKTLYSLERMSLQHPVIQEKNPVTGVYEDVIDENGMKTYNKSLMKFWDNEKRIQVILRTEYYDAIKADPKGQIGVISEVKESGTSKKIFTSISIFKEAGFF